MRRSVGGVAGRPLALRAGWYESIRLLLGVVAGAVTAVVAALAGVRWEWAGVFAVCSTVLVATRVVDGVLAQVVDPVRRWGDDRRERHRQVLAVLHEGTPGPLSLVDPYTVGVFASPAAEPYRAAAAARPPYVGRSIDGPLRRAIESLAAAGGGVVVVKGHPKAGKSRTLWEALAASRPPGHAPCTRCGRRTGATTRQPGRWTRSWPPT